MHQSGTLPYALILALFSGKKERGKRKQARIGGRKKREGGRGGGKKTNI
jgi:hypothetical protein